MTTATATYACSDSVTVARNGPVVTFERPYEGFRLAEGTLVMPGHALDDMLLDWALDGSVDSTHATVGGRVRGAVDLATFLTAHGYSDLSAEAYSRFLSYMRAARKRTRKGDTDEPLGESLQRQRAQMAKRVYGWGITHRPDLGWQRREYDSMGIAYGRAFAGYHARQVKEGQEKALTTDEFNRVLRACRRELVACRARVAAWEEAGSPASDVLALNLGSKGAQRVMNPNPFVVFYVLAALDASMRAEEFNTLTVGAHRDKLLDVHGPKHEPRTLTLDDHVETALRICEIYSDQIRAHSKDAYALLVYACDGLESPRSNRGVLRVKSGDIARWIGGFTERHRELLYADPRPGEEAGAAAPLLDLVPRLLRNDGLTQFALVERNMDVLRRHAQNTKEQTLERHYIRQREEERLAHTAQRLSGLAERIRMAAPSRIIAEPTGPEAQRLALMGALVPVGAGDVIDLGGHCHVAATSETAAALAAGYRPGCVRSGDCRMCDHFRVYTTRREVYVRSCAAKLEKATRIAREDGNLREAENLRRSAMLDQAIVDGIDAYLNGEI